MGLILAADGAVGINERVRLGDPVIGWRGDPNAIVYLNEDSAQAEVHLVDANGRYYVAAAHSVLDPGWRHELLRRLRDGDWQLGHKPFERVAAANAARDAAAEKAMSDINDEKAEKLAWAIRRDAGHLVGQSKEFY